MAEIVSSRGLIVAALLGAGLPGWVAGQAVVKGQVVTDSLGMAIPFAEVSIDELGKTVTASATGHFRLAGIPIGRFHLRIRGIGFQPAVAPLRIEVVDSVTLRIPLLPWIPQLETLLVTAPRASFREREMEERHRIGAGTLIRKDELRARDHSTLEDLLRAKGVGIRYDPARRPYPVSTRLKRLGGGGECLMTVLLNGAVASTDLSQYPVQALGAIEVFKSSLETPIQFSGTGRSCGVVVLWTRED